MAVRSLVKVLQKFVILKTREIFCFQLEKRKACEVVILWSLGRFFAGFFKNFGARKKKNFFFFFGKKKHKKLANTLWENFFFVSVVSRMGLKMVRIYIEKKIFLSIYKKSWISPKKWPKNVRSVTHAKYLIFQEVKKKNFPNVQKNVRSVTFFCLSWKIGFFEIFLSVESPLGPFFFHLLKY